VLKNDKQWSNQLVKNIQIVIFKIKLLILITLIIALRALINKTLYLFMFVTMLEYLLKKTFFYNYFGLSSFTRVIDGDGHVDFFALPTFDNSI